MNENDRLPPIATLWFLLTVIFAVLLISGTLPYLFGAAGFVAFLFLLVSTPAGRR